MTSALTFEELDRQAVELLPSRDTLALINITNIVAVNIALAVNAASINATANAAALQYIGPSQG